MVKTVDGAMVAVIVGMHAVETGDTVLMKPCAYVIDGRASARSADTILSIMVVVCP